MTTAERKQHIKVDDSQMEISSSSPAITENFEGKLAEAQNQLEKLQEQRRELEQQKVALQELNERKQEFLNGQLDLTEKFSSAITTIERDLFESKQEMEDLDQTRAAFVKHLQKIEALNPESWSKDSLSDELQRALMILDKADDEYDQAVSYFLGTRKASIFGGSTSSRSLASNSNDFHASLRNGFAFNLPLIILGTIALIIYLFK